MEGVLWSGRQKVYQAKPNQTPLHYIKLYESTTNQVQTILLGISRLPYVKSMKPVSQSKMLIFSIDTD